MSNTNLLLKYSFLFILNLIGFQRASSQLLELDFTSETKTYRNDTNMGMDVGGCYGRFRNDQFRVAGYALQGVHRFVRVFRESRNQFHVCSHGWNGVVSETNIYK